jgi:hypothetical protein
MSVPRFDLCCYFLDLLSIIICWNCYALLCLLYVKLTVPPLQSTARSPVTQNIDSGFNRRRTPQVLPPSAFRRVVLSATGFSGEL